MLRISQLSVSYGDIRALAGINLDVKAGAFVAIVGANGAGKSTLFKAISGTVPIVSGELAFDGHDLSKIAPAARAQLGIAHVPEGRQVFRSMTVLENLEMGAQTLHARQSFKVTLDQIYTLFPRLAGAGARDEQRDHSDHDRRDHKSQRPRLVDK